MSILITYTIFWVYPSSRYANCSEGSFAEGAVGYDPLPSAQEYENIYETIQHDPSSSHGDAVQIPPGPSVENIYERIEDIPRLGPRRISSDRNIARPLHQGSLDAGGPAGPGDFYNNLQDMPSCSSYGRIGNAYGRIDIIGHGIGRIERHLSSSCGSGIDNHYAVENFYTQNSELTGRISKVSVQWLLVNKWLPMWIANTGNGRDYRIIDFLLGQRVDYDNIPEKNNDEEQNPNDPS